MLVMAIIAGGMTAEAKTTKKKSSTSSRSSKSGTSKSSSSQVLYILPQDQKDELNLPVEKVTINRSGRTVRVKLKGSSQEKVHRIDWIDEDEESPGYNFVNGGFLAVYLYDGEITYSPDGYKMGYYEIDIDKSGLKSLLMDDDYKSIIGRSYFKKENDITTVLTFKNDKTVVWQAVMGGETKSMDLQWVYEGDGYLYIVMPDSGKMGFYFDDDHPGLYVLDKYGNVRWDYGPLQPLK